MSAFEEYTKQVVIDPEGITIGDVRVPGCISANVHVCADADIQDHWTIELVLLTGTAPVFKPGVSISPEGLLSIDLGEERP